MASSRYPSTGLWLPNAQNNYVSAPHQSSMDLTNLDIRVLTRIDNTSTIKQSFVGVWGAGTNARSYTFGVDVSGVILFQISTDGTAATILTHSSGTSAIPFSPGALGWFRVTYVASTGTATTFTAPYTGTSDSSGVTWTQRSTSSLGSNKVPFVSTAPLEIGSLSVGTSSNFGGYIYAVDIRNNTNNDGTGIIATPDFTTAGASPFTDAVGLAWTLNTSGTRPAKFVKRT